MKLTRHNGRSGRHGTYNPRHNDRRFDVENSEHIDAERARQNVYWDCYRGFTTHEFRENPEQPDFSFEEIERMYYYEHYGGHVEAQNARNEKTRHTERNRTVEDLLKNNKTCPEESIYQIGTMGESVPPDTLFSIVNEFYEEFERRFGSHIHILDWALHLDEGTPHIHERHVFDCENRYGELCPQQEKALEELGIPLPNPEKAKGAEIEQAAGQKCQPIGHIGYYYPAEVWISEYGKLYAKYEYQDEIECFPDVFALIERELRQCSFDSAAMKTVEALDGKL